MSRIDKMNISLPFTPAEILSLIHTIYNISDVQFAIDNLLHSATMTTTSQYGNYGSFLTIHHSIARL